MKNMYVITSEKRKIVAYHENYEPCETYVNNIKKTSKKDYEIHEIKKKRLRKYKNIEDLYLVRFHDTYIQIRFYDVAMISSEDFIYEYQYTKEILMRILESDNYDGEEKKSIWKTIKILTNIVDDCKRYTQPIEDLQYLEQMYNMYRDSVLFGESYDIYLDKDY